MCKPHGMPVHVAGQYRKNTVLGILTAECPDLGPLFPIHRRGAGRPDAGQQPAAPSQGTRHTRLPVSPCLIRSDCSHHAPAPLPVCRLDKPVSGLLLFARSAAAAAALCGRIEGHAVEKVYVARVLGRFPATGVCTACVHE